MVKEINIKDLRVLDGDIVTVNKVSITDINKIKADYQNHINHCNMKIDDYERERKYYTEKIGIINKLLKEKN